MIYNLRNSFGYCSCIHIKLHNLKENIILNFLQLSIYQTFQSFSFHELRNIFISSIMLCNARISLTCTHLYLKKHNLYSLIIIISQWSFRNWKFIKAYMYVCSPSLHCWQNLKIYDMSSHKSFIRQDIKLLNERRK